MSRWGLLLLPVLTQILAVAASEDQPAGRVDAAGSMRWGRASHRATLLDDGHVLITGGSSFSNEAPIPWAELYDPARQAFTDAGALHVPRHDHVAVLLEDGDVLVAGGWRAGYVEPTETAEIWDRETRTFTMAGNMTVARGSGTAVARLADGRVLLIGGTREGVYGTATDAIDVFDPRSRTFARWGALTMSRTAALVHQLDDDRLLVSGGGFRCCWHPASWERARSQEILDLRTRTAQRTADLPGNCRADAMGSVQRDGTPTLAVVTGAPALEFDGEWRILDHELTSLLQAHPFATRLSANRLLGHDKQFVVLDLGRATATKLHGPTWSTGPTVSVLREGVVLATGGLASDLRGLRSAWIVSVP